MPLIRGLARTAAIAGTATAVSNRVSRRQGQRWADQDVAAANQAAGPPQGYAEPPPAPATPARDPIEELKALGELHEQGVLTDEEFAVQKSKILNS
jgi:hypothetical protein